MFHEKVFIAEKSSCHTKPHFHQVEETDHYIVNRCLPCDSETCCECNDMGHCHETDKEGNKLCVPYHDVYHHCDDCHGDCRCFDPQG